MLPYGDNWEFTEQVKKVDGDCFANLNLAQDMKKEPKVTVVETLDGEAILKDILSASEKE